MTRPLSRRGFLRQIGTGAAAPLLATTLPAAGCLAADDTIEVVVVWSGRELSAFRAVLDRFAEATGHRERIDLVSAGDAIDSLLRSRLAAGRKPHVAVLPRPGMVSAYARAGWLRPLPPDIGDTMAPAWQRLVTVDGQLYGVWFKAAHKSLFWYRGSVLRGHRTPDTFDELVDLVQGLAASRAGGNAPLAIGAADGWVLTDWFENMLLATAGSSEYERLAHGEGDWRGEGVRSALHQLARLWSVSGALAGGPRRAMVTQFEDSVLDVFVHRQAGMVFEGDFVATVLDRLARAGKVPEPPGTPFRFPRHTGGVKPLVVGGDAVVLMREHTVARDLVRWLSRPEAAEPWLARGGFLSPNQRLALSRYRSVLARETARALHTDVGALHFDLSDQVGGGLTGGDGLGMWRILQDFFADVTRARTDIPASVTDTADRLAAAARRG